MKERERERERERDREREREREREKYRLSETIEKFCARITSHEKLSMTRMLHEQLL